MFCEKCGAQLPNDARFCENCGASMQPMMYSGYQSNANPFKKYTHFIALGLVIIAFVSSILMLSMQFDVTVEWSSMGLSRTVTAIDLPNKDWAAIFILSTFLFGLILIAAAIVGIVFFVKKIRGTGERSSGLFVTGLLGAIGAIVQIILIFASEENGVRANIPWFTWVILILFAGVAVLDKVVFNKKN